MPVETVVDAVRPAYWDEACADLMKRDRILRKMIPTYGPAHLVSRGDPSRGQYRILDQRAHDLDEAVGTRIDIAVRAVAYHRGQFGRGQAHDRHADHHRFHHRKAEAGVADRMEEEPVARHERGEFVIRDLPQAARRFGFHANEVERHHPAGVGEHVGAKRGRAGPGG